VNHTYINREQAVPLEKDRLENEKKHIK